MSTKSNGVKGEKAVSLVIDETTGYHKHLDNVFLVGGSGMTHQIDHIDIRSNGVFCIETKNIPGDISGTVIDNYWVQKNYVQNKLIIKKFHNPLMQNDSHRKILQRYLGDKYLYLPVVVFASNNISKLNVPDVIDLKDLSSYISTYDSDVNYSNKQIDAIYNKLLKYCSGISEKEHLHNIKNQINENKINKMIQIECLKQLTCPRCGEPLSFHGAFYKCSSRKCNYQITNDQYLKLIK